MKTKIIKNKIMFIILLATAVLILNQQAYCIENIPITSADNFLAIKESATKVLADIESDLSQRKYGDALSKAKSIEIEVFNKSGIEVKTPHFITEGHDVISSWDPKDQFNDLAIPHQVEISTQIKKQKNGHFLDFLNLAKRSSLLYVKALYHQRKESGLLKTRDLVYILTTVIRMHAIPIYFTNNSTLRVVFDSDSVDDIEHYEFNMELNDFILEDVEELRSVKDKANTNLTENSVSNLTSSEENLFKLIEMKDLQLNEEKLQTLIQNYKITIFNKAHLNL